MLSIESTAKTVKQAIEDGLKKLNKSIDEVEVKIISQPGIFRKAKVLITAAGAEPPKPELKREIKPEAKPVKTEPQLNPDADKKPRDLCADLEKTPTDNKGEKKDERPSHEKHGRRDERPSRDEKKDRSAHAHDKAQESSRQDRQQEPRRSAPPQQKNQQPDPQKRDDKDGQRNDKDGQREPRKKNDSGRRAQTRAEGDNKDRFDKKEDNRRERDFPRESEHKERRERDNSHDSESREHKEREYREITDEAAATAADFVEGVLSRMNVPYSMLRKRENGALLLDITSESGAIIGYRGETLDSIEYLASLTVNRNSDKYYKIGVDCNGYRVKREEMLAAMAVRLAEKAVKTQRKVIMEPMNNFSRKVVHSALADNDKIFTRSEGVEPNRHIVIIPKRNK